MKRTTEQTEAQALQAYLSQLEERRILQQQRKKAVTKADGKDWEALAELQQQFFQQLFEVKYSFYKWDEVNAWILPELALYFFSNPLFERPDSPIPGASLKKGLMLCGNVGTGKTLLLEILSEISRQIPELAPQRFHKIGCKAIVAKYRQFCKLKDTSEEEILDIHTYKSFYMKKEGLGRSKKPIIKGFDGLGEEMNLGPVNNYGTIINVMEEIILVRYDMFLEYGMKTHITTNLADSDDLRETYSAMLADRCKQKFNKIAILGESKRK